MDIKRELVLQLHLMGKKNFEILEQLKNQNTNRRFIERTLSRYYKTGSCKIMKKVGRPRTVRNKKMIKVVRERIRRNCAVSTRKLGNQLGMSHQSVHLLIKNDLGFKAYKKRRLHGLTDKQKVARVNRCRKLFRWHADSQIIFSDEKMFFLQQSHNPQNDRLYAPNMAQIPLGKKVVQRYQNVSSVMVWAPYPRKASYRYYSSIRV